MEENTPSKKLIHLLNDYSINSEDEREFFINIIQWIEKHPIIFNDQDITGIERGIIGYSSYKTDSSLSFYENQNNKIRLQKAFDNSIRNLLDLICAHEDNRDIRVGFRYKSERLYF
jgi:hypothetical protein